MYEMTLQTSLLVQKTFPRECPNRKKIKLTHYQRKFRHLKPTTQSLSNIVKKISSTQYKTPSGKPPILRHDQWSFLVPGIETDSYKHQSQPQGLVYNYIDSDPQTHVHYTPNLAS